MELIFCWHILQRGEHLANYANVCLAQQCVCVLIWAFNDTRSSWHTHTHTSRHIQAQISLHSPSLEQWTMSNLLIIVSLDNYLAKAHRQTQRQTHRGKERDRCVIGVYNWKGDVVGRVSREAWPWQSGAQFCQTCIYLTVNLLDAPTTVSSPVGYLFKFHIETICGKAEGDREEQRERVRKGATVESWVPCVCRANFSRWAPIWLGCLWHWNNSIISLQSVENIMIFASSIATL